MSKPSTVRHWVRLLAVLIAALLALALLVAVLASFAAHTNASPQAVQGWVAGAHTFRVWGTAVQCLIVALAGIFWQPLMLLLVRRGIAQPHEQQRLLALRWRAVMWGALYLLLVPIGPTAVWQALTSLF